MLQRRKTLKHITGSNQYYDVKVSFTFNFVARFGENDDMKLMFTLNVPPFIFETKNMAWNISEGFEFGIFVRDDVIVEVCCKVGSEFVCPTKVPLFFKLCVTELSSVVVDNICDISFFLFSFNVLYLFSELGFLCPVICIACSSGTFLSMSF